MIIIFPWKLYELFKYNNTFNGLLSLQQLRRLKRTEICCLFKEGLFSLMKSTSEIFLLNFFRLDPVRRISKS